MFDAIAFCQDYNIKYWEGGSKNVSKGWIGLNCPFCDDRSNHLGIEIDTGRCLCWRCGSKKLNSVIYTLTRDRNTNEIITKYSWTKYKKSIETKPKSSIKIQGTKDISLAVKKYFELRNFDYIYLTHKYDLYFGEPYTIFEYRIIIPIKLQNEIIAYQTRKIFKSNKPKYINSNNDNSVIQIKDICYNLDNCQQNEAIAVEGVTDVWRIGDNSFATFGTCFTTKQLNLIRDRFKKIYWLFDSEKQAQNIAQKAAKTLTGMGIDVDILNIKGIKDPGSISDDDAIALKKELRLF